MRKALEAGGHRAFRRGQHGQQRAAAAVAVLSRPPAEDAVAILPQDLDIPNPICIKSKGRVQSPDSPRSRSLALHVLPCDSANE